MVPLLTLDARFTDKRMVAFSGIRFGIFVLAISQIVFPAPMRGWLLPVMRPVLVEGLATSGVVLGRVTSGVA